MKFKVAIADEKLVAAAQEAFEVVMVELMLVVANAIDCPDARVKEWYEPERYYTWVAGELPDTPEAQRAVTELMALAQGHELPMDEREGAA